MNLIFELQLLGDTGGVVKDFVDFVLSTPFLFKFMSVLFVYWFNRILAYFASSRDAPADLEHIKPHRNWHRPAP